jgi:hypothetical protein
MALSMVMSSAGGISFDLVGVRQRDVERARDVPHGRLRLHRPERDDLATFSRPYFRVTYSMTSPRRRSQKSMSISGSDTRSGFRKRSKMRSYCSGSTSVMRGQNATRLPAADPRPGPTGIPCSRALANEIPDDQEIPA